jgi:hypothetical protein
MPRLRIPIHDYAAIPAAGSNLNGADMSSPAPSFDHTDAAQSPMLARVAHIDRTLEWKRDMLARANGEYACELEQDIKILEHDREWLLGQDPKTRVGY